MSLSLIFYGVRSKEAATLRMAGVPRVAAEGLAEAWRAEGRTAQSFESVRSWLRDLNEGSWNEALAPDSPLSGTECRRVWGFLAGEPSLVD
jgi:hypothetical protein